jgi:transposase
MGKSKYSLSFKKSCVEKIIKGNCSVRSLSKELGIGTSILSNWIRFYNRYGEAGLMRSTNRIFDSGFKLQVLHYIEKNCSSLRQASLEFNIPERSMIRNWQIAYQKSGILGLENKPRGRPCTMSDYKRKKRKSNQPLTREEELLLENERLRAEIAVLKKLDALILAKKKPKS